MSIFLLRSSRVFTITSLNQDQLQYIDLYYKTIGSKKKIKGIITVSGSDLFLLKDT